jgi:hypothetical protein
LELIHSDVWISPISSIDGSKFYVLFIDDFSRYTWLFPIHNKSNVLGMLVKFKCLVENLFTLKIKQFQRDGGGEYLTNTFTNFLSTHGILHRVTCPHTSQQNGIAKRKHRHIIETALTLLAQSHLPARYWIEAVCTSTYLINRLPTLTLNNSCPFSNLFHKNLYYSLLRTFGCACYPLLRLYAKHKLEFRSKQGLFLGYSSNQKGYTCLDISTNWIYISRHIIFDEMLFSAKDWAAPFPAKVDLSQLGIVLHPSHFISVHTPSFSSVHPLILMLLSHLCQPLASPINIPLVVVSPAPAVESVPQEPEFVTQEPYLAP